MKPTKNQKLLTEAELEMMRVIWRQKGATVHEVQEALAPQKKLAYTSVSTILRILEQKGVLSSHKEGRGHVYSPKIEKEEYERRSLQHLVTQVFEGEASQLVSRLLEMKGIKADELSQIKELLKHKGE